MRPNGNTGKLLCQIDSSLVFLVPVGDSANETAIDRFQNRRKSQLRRLQNRFLGCFSGFGDPKSRVFDRNPLICIPYLAILSRVMSIALDSTTGANGDRKSTECDTKSTDHDILTTLGDTFTTLRDTFSHDTNSDLRRIVCDFLTSGIRVGETNPKPTDDRPWELPQTKLACGTRRASPAQMRNKPLDLRPAHLVRMPFFVEKNELRTPAHVRLFGADAIVQQPTLRPKLIHQFRRRSTGGMIF